MNNYYNNELYHYGVKGMKWRTRKKKSLAETARWQTIEADAKEWEKAAKRRLNNKDYGGTTKERWEFVYKHRKQNTNLARNAKIGKQVAAKILYRIRNII